MKVFTSVLILLTILLGLVGFSVECMQSRQPAAVSQVRSAGKGNDDTLKLSLPIANKKNGQISVEEKAKGSNKGLWKLLDHGWIRNVQNATTTANIKYKEIKDYNIDIAFIINMIDKYNEADPNMQKERRQTLRHLLNIVDVINKLYNEVFCGTKDFYRYGEKGSAKKRYQKNRISANNRAFFYLSKVIDGTLTEEEHNQFTEGISHLLDESDGKVMFHCRRFGLSDDCDGEIYFGVPIRGTTFENAFSAFRSTGSTGHMPIIDNSGFFRQKRDLSGHKNGNLDLQQSSAIANPNSRIVDRQRKSTVSNPLFFESDGSEK